MPASVFQAYKSWPLRVKRQEFDFLNSEIRALLIDNEYTPDLANHHVQADVDDDECEDSDYSQQVLAEKSVYLDGSGRTVVDADDVDWGDDVTISARYVVLVSQQSVAWLVNDAYYQWTASGSGTDEYYLEALGGGDPGFPEPFDVREDSVSIDRGTAGSLSASEWDYGDNDTLGFSTVYIRLADGEDPDGKAFGFVAGVFRFLMGLIDLNEGGSTNVSSVGSHFKVIWNENGIYRFTP